MLCYAIIVTYNGAKWIDRCLGSLTNSTVPLNIIVIDNNSKDGTSKIIRHKYPKAEVIETGHNLGFGKANNIGLKKAYQAGADLVFLINQDAWVEQDTLEILIDAAKHHQEYGIVSPLHLNGEGNALDYGFINYLCGSKIRNYLSDLYLKPKNQLDEIYQVDFVNGAFWLLPRKTIETVGGFNPFFFQYGEDRDYVNRCNFFNLKVGFVPFAKAYHDRAQYDSKAKSKVIVRLFSLVKLFNPCEDLTIHSHIKVLAKSALKSFLTFHFQQTRYFITELMFFYSNRKRIKAISSRLKVAGLTFLE